MAYSGRFQALDKRLSELKSNFIPTTFSPEGNYTPNQMDLAKGYRFLAHAEVEAYLEDRCEEIRLLAISEWHRESRTSVPLLAMLVYWNANWSYDSDLAKESKFNKIPPKENGKDISFGINRAAMAYCNIIKYNNGIKSDNLRKLLPPVGVDFADLDSSWLALMDSFGESRGIVAHSSASATKEINPQDELNSVSQLRAGLISLDEKFDFLLKSINTPPTY